MKNILIIGSGMGGLMAGVKLSKEGHKVTIIEKHMIVGGYATNFQRKAKTGEKVVFDASLHGIGDLTEGRILYDRLDRLDIFKKVKVLKKKETGTIVLKNGEEIDIPDDFDLYSTLMTNRFPDDKQDIEKLFSFLMEFSKDMESSMRSGVLPEYIYKLQDISLYDFLKTYTNNEQFIDIFSFLWLYYGLPSKELNAYYYLVAWLGYHIGGTYYIEGGGGEFSKSLAEIIKENGGDIVLKEEVTKLNTMNNKITSVTTDKGRTFSADYFIINGCIENVINLIDNKSLVSEYLSKITKLDSSFSLSQLYIGLDCDPTTLGVEKADLFYNNGYNVTDSYEHIRNADYENTPFGIVNYNILDPKLNKDTGFMALTIGDFIGNWAKHGTDEYIKQKERVTNIFLEKIYKLFPKIEGHVVITELGTPRTMARYTNNKNGAVYGFQQNVEQGGFNRLGQKTPLDNTYVAGAWTQPGGGYQGAIISGISCGDIITGMIKSEEERTVVHKRDSIPSKMFIIGMIKGANIEYAKDIVATYKFTFKDLDVSYVVKVNQGDISLDKSRKSPVDTEIICDYKIWEDIANNIIIGGSALKNGDFVIKGDPKKFNYVHKLFSTEKINTQKPNKKNSKIAHPNILVPIALVPWILYWSISTYYDGVWLFLIGALYPLIIMPLIKPKGSKRETTLLERVTIIGFVSYYVLNTLTDSPYIKYFELILPISFALSCLTKTPATAEYSKFMYNDYVQSTKLFRQINIKITLVWSIIFTIQFVFVRVLFTSPIVNILYVLNIIGIAFSFLYPRSLSKQ